MSVVTILINIDFLFICVFIQQLWRWSIEHSTSREGLHVPKYYWKLSSLWHLFMFIYTQQINIHDTNGWKFIGISTNQHKWYQQFEISLEDTIFLFLGRVVFFTSFYRALHIYLHYTFIQINNVSYDNQLIFVFEIWLKSQIFLLKQGKLS